MAHTLIHRGELKEARQMLEESIPILEKGQDYYNSAVSLLTLIGLDRYEGRLREGREHGHRALKHAEGISHQVLVQRVHVQIANLAWAEGHYAEARASYEVALSKIRDAGDRLNEGLYLGNIGDLALAEGQVGEARAKMKASIEILREADPGGAHAAHILGNLSDVERIDEKFDVARSYLGDALSDLRTTGSTYQIAEQLGRAAVLAACFHDSPAAAALHGATETLCQNSGVNLWITLEEALAQHLAPLADHEPRWEEFKAEGRRLPTEEAVQRALDWLGGG